MTACFKTSLSARSTEDLKPAGPTADRSEMRFPLTFLKTHLVFLLLTTPSFAQVFGSGGIPGPSDQQEVYCNSILGDSRVLEGEYLELRGIPKKDDESFLREIRRLAGDHSSQTPLLKASCVPQQIPAHTHEQMVILKKVEKIWIKGCREKDHCLKLFKTRSRVKLHLECILRFLGHEKE